MNEKMYKVGESIRSCNDEKQLDNCVDWAFSVFSGESIANRLALDYVLHVASLKRKQLNPWNV